MMRAISVVSLFADCPLIFLSDWPALVPLYMCVFSKTRNRNLLFNSWNLITVDYDYEKANKG